MMVVPAQCDEVVGIVIAAVVLFLDVVRLQPVTAAASLDRALAPVPLENECSNRWGDRLGSVGNCERSVDGALADHAATVGRAVGVDSPRRAIFPRSALTRPSG